MQEIEPWELAKLRLHIAELNEAGMRDCDIAIASGVSGTTVGRLSGAHAYTAGRDRQKSVAYRRNYDRIMAVHPDFTLVGLQRRLQALGMEGFPGKFLAEQLGCSMIVLLSVRLGYHPSRKTPVQYTAFGPAIVALYEKLAGQKPEDFGVTPHQMASTIGKARKYGWAPSIAWDWDTIDDKHAVADFTGYCGTLRGHARHVRHEVPFHPACRCKAAHAQDIYNRRHPGEELPIEEFLTDRRKNRSKK